MSFNNLTVIGFNQQFVSEFVNQKTDALTCPHKIVLEFVVHAQFEVKNPQIKRTVTIDEYGHQKVRIEEIRTRCFKFKSSYDEYSDPRALPKDSLERRDVILAHLAKGAIEAEDDKTREAIESYAKSLKDASEAEVTDLVNFPSMQSEFMETVQEWADEIKTEFVEKSIDARLTKISITFSSKNLKDDGFSKETLTWTSTDDPSSDTKLIL